MQLFHPKKYRESKDNKKGIKEINREIAGYSAFWEKYKETRKLADAVKK